MDNINYIIQEEIQPAPFDIHQYASDLYHDDTIAYSMEELYSLYTQYNVKSLDQMLEYYGLSKYNINTKKKLVKEELIQILVLFETDISNYALVLKRRRLWQNIRELIHDSFFKNFITFME
jgi:hypothetical protein